jgi:hypothetical protein
MIRRSRLLRVLAAAPRIAVMTYASAQPRFVPEIRHNHRIPKRSHR